jgi:hypothetical protein
MGEDAERIERQRMRRAMEKPTWWIRELARLVVAVADQEKKLKHSLVKNWYHCRQKDHSHNLLSPRFGVCLSPGLLGVIPWIDQAMPRMNSMR